MVQTPLTLSMLKQGITGAKFVEKEKLLLTLTSSPSNSKQESKEKEGKAPKKSTPPSY